MEKAAKIKFFLLVAAVVVAAVVMEKTYLTAASPSSVKVTVYKAELMTAVSDANPQVFFSDASGQEIDLISDSLIGQAQMPPDTYKRIRMTVANGIKQSIASAADNPCGGDTIFTDRIFPIAKGTDPNSQVQINFATYDDRGGTWEGSRVTHILLAPVTVSENQSTQVKFRFKTANSLFCSNGTVEIRSPWAAWAETL